MTSRLVSTAAWPADFDLEAVCCCCTGCCLPPGEPPAVVVMLGLLSARLVNHFVSVAPARHACAAFGTSTAVAALLAVSLHEGMLLLLNSLSYTTCGLHSSPASSWSTGL
jgi:hypothetical protein